MSLSDRRISWSKNTNYVSVASPRPPMEIGNHAHAPNKSVEQRLEADKQTLTQMQRKSLVMMAGQRKLLEKSMLAYSEKMKEINEHRTSDLFREIQSRNGACSQSLPDMHMSHVNDLEEIPDFPTVKTRHKRNSEAKVGVSPLPNGTNKRTSVVSDENTAPLKQGNKEDFSRLRSLLRRSSSADLISAVTIRQELNKLGKPMTRFVSTQSLIETADYLEDYRQKVQSQFKPKKHSKHHLLSDKDVKQYNSDSAYSSGFDSSDEMHELDIEHHSIDKTDRHAPLRKGHKKLSLSKRGRHISKAKPKLIPKGKKLLTKMNTEDITHTENHRKFATLSSLHKPDEKSLS